MPLMRCRAPGTWLAASPATRRWGRRHSFGVGACAVVFSFQHPCISSDAEPPFCWRADRRRGWVGRSSGGSDRDAHQVRRVRDRDHHAAVRRPDTCLQPSQPDRRCAGCLYRRAAFSSPAPFEGRVLKSLLDRAFVAMGLTWAGMRSKVGLSLAAVRADEGKAAAIGVRVQGVKLLAFCVSVGLTAMVGAVRTCHEGLSTRSSPSTRWSRSPSC